MDEKLSIFVNYFAIENPRTDLIYEDLVAFFEDDAQGFLKPEVAVQVFLENQVDNVPSPNALVVNLVDQSHQLRQEELVLDHLCFYVGDGEVFIFEEGILYRYD